MLLRGDSADYVRRRMAAQSRSRKGGGGALLAIAIFKWTKGAILLAMTFGAISLFGKDVGAQAEHWLDLARIDPDNRYIAAMLQRLDVVHTHELKELTFLTGFYAALFLTEGTGLALRKRWAEYLTIVATGLFIPLEIYELWKQVTMVRGLLLSVNVAVLVFLIWVVRIKQSKR